MDKEQIRDVFTKIGEGEGDVAISAAKELVFGAKDTDLRRDITDMFVRLLAAKESTQQDQLLEEYIKYVKVQMSLVYVQAFRGGRSHQMLLQNEQTQKLIQMATKLQNDEKVNTAEFLVPKGAPVQYQFNNESPLLSGKYMGANEETDCAIVEVIDSVSGQLKTVEIDWGLISIDREEIQQFLRDQELVADQE